MGTSLCGLCGFNFVCGVCVCACAHARAVFGMNVYHLFLHCMLAVISLIGCLNGVVMTRACPDYRAGPPLCSVVASALSGAAFVLSLLM